jgi:predicted DsbA family dithiol-disulfide isomerase
MSATLTIEVISDVVCPWCYIGKKRLETALAQLAAARPDVTPVVRWRPFQLNPDMPAEGISRETYVQRKFGRPAADVYQRVEGEGKTVGIDFRFADIARQPNTVKAHALVERAGATSPALQGAVKESLMQGYFLEGADLTDDATLLRLAQRAGFTEDVPSEDAHGKGVFGDPSLAQVRALDEEAREMGVSGVPFFIFNGKLAVSGAHAPETLLGAMQKSMEANA